MHLVFLQIQKRVDFKMLFFIISHTCRAHICNLVYPGIERLCNNPFFRATPC